MYFPKINVIKKYTEMQDKFLGYNGRTVIAENQFHDESNLSSIEYPIMRPRKKRNKKLLFSSTADCKMVLCSNNELAYLKNKDLYYGDQLVASNFGSGEKDILVSMGSRIVTFPGKKLYDVEESKVTNLESSFRPIFTGASTSYGEGGSSGEFSWTNNLGTIKKKTKFIITIPLSENIFGTGSEEDKARFVNFCNTVINNNLDFKEGQSPYYHETSTTFNKVEDCEVYIEGGIRHLDLKINVTAKREIRKNAIITTDSFSWSVYFYNTDAPDSTYARVFMINSSGYEFKNVVKQGTAPTSPSEGDTWIDTSVTPSIMKMWSGSSSMWSQVLSAKYKIVFENMQLPTEFKQYDTVTIDAGNLNGTQYEQNDVSGEWVIQEIGSNYLIINAVLNEVSYEFYDKFNITRLCPDMEFVCEADNRLWGCNSKANEIYSCKLGDPTNWYAYEDISTDSYAVTVGSEGAFTGCFNYLSYILFFKEDYVHKIYGTKPQNYCLKTMKVDGIEAGAFDTCVLIENTLFYKGKHGIYVYNGGIPSKISEVLGETRYRGGHGAQYDGKYFISFEECAFTYDVKYGIWHKEPSKSIISNIVNHYLDMYFITKEGSNYYLNRQDTFSEMNIEESDISWYGETGEIGLSLPNKKWISKLIIRASMSAGSYFCIKVQYDSFGEFQKVYESSGERRLETVEVAVIPQRCDHMKIRFEGIGVTRLYSITKVIEQGSEM